MICHWCKDGYHTECPAGNWCDCQHKPRGDGLVIDGFPGTFTIYGALEEKRDP